MEQAPLNNCFRNFRKNFIFANSIKRHVSDLNISGLSQGLPISINDSDFPISRGVYMLSFKKIKSSRKIPNLQYMVIAMRKPDCCMRPTNARIIMCIRTV